MAALIRMPGSNMFSLGVDVGVAILRRRAKISIGIIPFVVAMVVAISGLPAVGTQEGAATSDATPEAEDEALVPSFTIYPKETGPRTFFDATQDAGTSQDFTVVLVNAGGAEHGDFVGRTFAVDVRTKVNGGLESGGPNEAKTGATTWLDYPNDEVTLAPGKGIERTFTVTVPEGTPSGQYVTALCFETAEPIAIPGVPNVKQNLRQTIAFYLTVPGEMRPEFSIENVHITSDPIWSGIEAEIVNSGNVVVRPEGRVTVSSLDGTPLVTNEIAFGAFYAGQTGIIQTGFGDVLPSGEYLITIELRDPETGATAIVENQQVATTTQGELAAAEAPPVAFSAAAGILKPSAEEPQFLSLDATIANGGEPVADAELSLRVTRDGELVENYVVVSPLSLPSGETDVSSRYIPVDGWEPGTWAFTLSVQVQDRETGIAQVLSTVSLGDPIVIS